MGMKFTSRVKDITGEKYGKLTVLEYMGNNNYRGSMWKCRCDCGNEVVRSRNHLLDGKYKNCGCHSKIKDLTGKKFGRLTAIEFIGQTYPCKEALWKCICDCGNVHVVESGSLSSGGTASCGCARKEFLANLNKLEYGEAAFNNILSIYKVSARKHKREFSLPVDRVKLMVTSNCHYCGKPPSKVFRKKNANGEFVYNGIDRIDNSKGYTMDNTVSCCTQCNVAKATHSVDEFKQWIKSVYSYLDLGMLET